MKIIYKSLITTILVIIIGATVMYQWGIRNQDNSRKVRSYIYLINKYILHHKYLVANSIYGTKFKFKSKDAVGRAIYKDKHYEPILTKFVLEKISYGPTDLIIDVGANLGWYSINISKFYPNNKIFAFEPDDINFAILNENIKLNNSSNITAINKAVAQKNDKLTLYKYPEKNLGRHSLLQDNTLKQQQIVVDTVSIDEFITKNHLIDHKIKLIKIDVEGYEYQVLLGCIKSLPKIEYILHEFSPKIMQQHNISPEQLIKLLLDNNFEPFTFTQQGTLQSVNLSEILNSLEVTELFWKNNSYNSKLIN